MRKPSETTRGRAWLSNFSRGDRASAARLIDSLKFVSGTEFRSAMVDMITHHIENLARLGPTAIHPVRNDKVFRKDPFAGERGLIGSGSALVVLNLAEEIAEAQGPLVSLAPDLSQLRDGRIRNIVLIDDFVGSGRSVIECIKLWRANPTIRSWTSYHLVQFHLLAFSYCTLGYKKLENSGIIPMQNVRTFSNSDDFSGAGWTEEEENEIRRVCSVYSNNVQNPFGHGGAAALIVFDHTVPNNLPRILLQDKDKAGNPWIPFFAPGDRRLDPEQAIELAGYRPYTARPEVIRGGLGVVESELGIVDRDMFTVLRAIESGLTIANQIQQKTFLTDFQVRVLIERATGLGLLGSRGTLTESGFEWLIGHRHVAAEADEHEPPYYYPSQLRGGDGV